jgi:hypothetical protein
MPAYVVVPAVYAFKERGVAMSESARMTFVLKKGRGRLADPRLDVDGPESQGRRGHQALSLRL